MKNHREVSFKKEVSAKPRVQDTNLNQLKLNVNDT